LQRDTIEEGVCDGFSQDTFTTDFIGHRVAATGAYVVDKEHGWIELHPVPAENSVRILPASLCDANCRSPRWTRFPFWQHIGV
jgi:hypothetical protein